MNENIKLYLGDFVAAFPHPHGNHGNVLWQAVVASLRPADTPSEEEFCRWINDLSGRLRGEGHSNRECRQIKRVLCASYWPGPPGEPKLIEAVGDEYRVGQSITVCGLKSYVAILRTEPSILERIPSLSRSGLKVLEQLSQSAHM